MAVANSLYQMARARNWEQCLSTLGTMQNRCRSFDIVNFNICIHACRHRWEQALACFRHARQQRLQPSVATFGSLFAALGAGHRWVQVLSLLQHVPRTWDNTFVLTNVVLGVFKKAHRWDLAVELCAGWSMARTLDHVGMMELVGACSKSYRWQEALSLACGCPNQGPKEPKQPKLQVYNWLLYGFRGGACWQAGIALLSAASRHVATNTVSHRHLMFLLEAAPWQQAIQLLQDSCGWSQRWGEADAETIVLAIAIMECQHRPAENRHIFSQVVHHKLCVQRRDGSAAFTGKGAHNITILHDSWMKAGLTSLLEPAWCRHFLSPVSASLRVKCPVQSSAMDRLSHTTLKNAHVVPGSVARLASEVNSLRGASRWRTTWWKQAQLALRPLFAESTILRRADAGTVRAWIGSGVRHIANYRQVFAECVCSNDNIVKGSYEFHIQELAATARDSGDVRAWAGPSIAAAWSAGLGTHANPASSSGQSSFTRANSAWLDEVLKAERAAMAAAMVKHMEDHHRHLLKRFQDWSELQAKNAKSEMQKAALSAAQDFGGATGGSIDAERARLKSLAETLEKEREELNQWKTSAFVQISDHKSAVANAAAAAIALESGSAAKFRWKLATARIVNLLGNRNKISLVDKMKKNMKASMLATMPEFNDVPAERHKTISVVWEERSPMEMLLRGVPCLRRVVTSYVFELIFVSLILLNCISMMVQIEFFGLFLATSMGIKTGMETDYNEIFYNIELGFGLVFSAEILVKFVAYGLLDFWKFGWNLLDLFIVLTWAIDAGGLAVEINPMVFRMLRIAKLGRIVRVLKVIQRFDSLHLLLGSIRASFDILAWSALVLLILMTVCALALSQFLQGWIEASSSSDDIVRQEVWKLFGTVGRSIVSMFELTLANYSGITRSLMENVSAWFAVAILIYKLVVGFAVLKVITGIFIQQTMRVANEDDELLLLQKKRLVDSHAKGVAWQYAVGQESNFSGFTSSYSISNNAIVVNGHVPLGVTTAFTTLLNLASVTRVFRLFEITAICSDHQFEIF
ncbi:SCN4A [Symbiodinium sp. CCMP2592]|nr:SCN4A [Symbiodinium sp. CCMP2592]